MDFVVFQGDVVLEDAVPAHSVSRQRWGGAACAMEERGSALVISNECARALKHPKTQQEAQNAPLLEPDLFGACAGLRGDELLQVSDGVIRVAFNSDLLSKTIVTNHLDHALNKRDTETDSTHVCVQRNRLKTGEWCWRLCRCAPSHPTRCQACSRIIQRNHRHLLAVCVRSAVTFVQSHCHKLSLLMI
jgi:hypothetical protein